MDRRGFLKTLGLAGVTVACPKGAAAAPPEGAGEAYGVLVDTTRCVGCNTCTYACAEANGLPEPDEPENVHVTSENQWTAIQSFKTSRGTVHVKRQCMHCALPACASACLTQAMKKSAAGPVEWREDKCMGCRFCMISCPFDMPKFEYSSAKPRIRKCSMCADRVRKGQEPACVESCPEGALTFGKRSDLLQMAEKRIATEPGRYVPQIYGEREVGGTSWLYLAGVPFDQIGFRTDLDNEPYPMLTTGFLYNVPVVLAVVPPLLLALSKATRRAAGEDGEGEGTGAGDTSDDAHEEAKS
ncbi:MAG TPA: 4Fe-4S dicluster domain-containing protein [Candidatus Eisenbacteria bacterium]